MEIIIHFKEQLSMGKHQESQENDGQTGSWCLDKAVLARDARHQKNACPENLPIPHPKHNSHNRVVEHNVQANFSKFWRSSLPIRAIRSCGIEALSNLAPHIQQLHMLAFCSPVDRMHATAMPAIGG